MAVISIFSKDIQILDGLFSLNDLHKAGDALNKHRPSLFVANAQTQELIEEISQSSNSCLAIKTIHGGKNRGTYVCKELVYAYAMWISAKFHLAVIRAFDQLSVAPNQSPIGKKGHECLAGLIDGKTSHLQGKQRTSAKARLWAQLRKAYSVDAAADITADELDSARQFVGSYVLEGDYLPAGEVEQTGQLALGDSVLEYRYKEFGRTFHDGQLIIQEIKRYLPRKAHMLLRQMDNVLISGWMVMNESLMRIDNTRSMLRKWSGLAMGRSE